MNAAVACGVLPATWTESQLVWTESAMPVLAVLSGFALLKELPGSFPQSTVN